MRRFNPSHSGSTSASSPASSTIQQMDVQTYFFRRSNMNALGQPRSWTDHLLWHHACTRSTCSCTRRGSLIVRRMRIQGPMHPELGSRWT